MVTSTLRNPPPKGTADFFSGKATGAAYRVLADATLLRRATENHASSGHRPQVLRRVQEPLQLSLFSELEPSKRPTEPRNRRATDPDYLAPDTTRSGL